MDVYSIGVVLFEMLVGVRPFDAPTFQELAQKVRKEPPPALRSFRRDLPLELEHVILRALSKNREDRWSTAAEFAAALVPFGGRNIELDTDQPSDSFTMDLVKIRARETQRQRTLKPEDIEQHAAKHRRAPAPPTVEPPPPTPLSSVDIVVSLEDDLHSTDSRNRGASGVAHREGHREALRPTASLTEALEEAARHGAEPAAAPAVMATDTATAPRVVSGKLVLAVMRFVATRFSERALKRVLDGVPAGVRPLFVRGIAADDWVPFEAFVHLEQQVDAQLGRDDLHLVAQCGRAAADAAEDVLRIIAPKAIPPEILLAELPAVVSDLMKGLELKVRGVGRGYARIELLDTDPSCLTTCVSMLGFIDGSLGHCTAKEVEVNLVSSTALGDEESAYELSWVI
jgi:serine/threonine-protein kinase